jgi:hypothetical protein
MRSIKKTSSISVIENNETNIKNDVASLGDTNENEYKITVRLSAALIDTLKNIITSNKAGGDFEYINVSDLLRKSLTAYKNGMSLIVQRTKDQKKETSFRATKELKDFYTNLPNNTKSEIIERAVNTFIKHKM